MKSFSVFVGFFCAFVAGLDFVMGRMFMSIIMLVLAALNFWVARMQYKR